MRSIRWLPLCFAVACGGDDAGAPDDAATDAADDDGAPTDADVDSPPGDADADVDGPPVACPTFEDCETRGRPGVIFEDGCAPVACGFWRYQRRDVTAQGE
jgi:hypothetical protein